MKIKFGLTEELPIAYPKTELEKYSWVGELYSTDETQNKIEEILKERFKSVKIYYYKQLNQSFSFREIEDEMAFLLWSSGEGIEI